MSKSFHKWTLVTATAIAMGSLMHGALADGSTAQGKPLFVAAGDSASDTMERAGHKTGETMEKAGEKASDTMDDAGDTMDKAGDTMNKAGRSVSDTWITSKVKASFLADDSLSGTDIKVETNKGVVSLSGTVASKAEKKLAIQKAKGIEGVRDVSAEGLDVAD